MSKQFDKQLGAIIGHAVGDALGALTERMKPKQIKVLYGEVEDFHEEKRQGKLRRLPRLYTDDTQFALTIMTSLSQTEDFDEYHAAEVYKKFSEPLLELPAGVYRGTGRTSRNAMQALREGVDPLRAGQDSMGNGAAIRIPPLAIRYQNDIQALGSATIRSALMTHGTAASVLSACALAYTIALESIDTDLDALSKLELITELVGNSRKEFLDKYSGRIYTANGSDELRSTEVALRNLQDILTSDVDEVREQIANVANLYTNGLIPDANHGMTLASTITSIYLGLTQPSFEAAIKNAVNAGYDADSVAAMTGAIQGARHGFSSIPRTWVDEMIGSEELQANTTLFLEGKPIDTDAVYRQELSLTKQDVAFRKP